MLKSTNSNDQSGQNQAGSSSGGMLSCLLIVSGIAASYWAFYGLEWMGSPQLHTEMEELATSLALVVGLMAIVNYYSQRNGLALLLGVAFLGTATLDGYHTIVTSAQFKQYSPPIYRRDPSRP